MPAQNQPDAYVIGAGVAGLTAAFYLARANLKVCVLESTKLTGGRCRTFTDITLGTAIDNGTHLALTAYHELLALVGMLGSSEYLQIYPAPAIPVFNGENGTFATWQSQDNFSLMQPFTLRDMWAVFRLMGADDFATVDQCIPGNTPFQERLQLICRSMLNTPTETASARLFWKTMQKIMKSGHRDWVLPKQSWGKALLEPLEKAITNMGGEVRFQQNVRNIMGEKNTANCIGVGMESLFIDEKTLVVLATPPSVTQALVPYVKIPSQYHSILNVHFLRPEQPSVPDYALPAVMVVRGAAEWVFARHNVISTTTSALTLGGEDEVVDDDAPAPESLVQMHWQDVCRAYSWPVEMPMPAYRVITEKRAAMACTPKNLLLRPETRTAFANCFLAGDYVETGLPGTLESAVVAGKRAAGAGLKFLRRQQDRDAA